MIIAVTSCCSILRNVEISSHGEAVTLNDYPLDLTSTSWGTRRCTGKQSQKTLTSFHPGITCACS